jgi:DNA helicase-2/ATP-dependent DNA helicase PcrA
LIIDEAQDFNPAMFEFLRMVGRKLPKGGVTVLADENQRLEEGYNSSIDDIRANLRIKVDCEFKLTQNFRNTRPIAEVARFFYAGLQSGMPDLPERDGNKPQLITATDEFTQVKYIKNFLQFRGAQEVGVIVDSERDREFFAEQLKTALPNYHIQSYTSKEPLLSESLLFDSESQGVITILNRRSCKGLEFDTVFIPELQSFKFDDTNLATFQMNLYVMCSRARTELIIMKSNGINESAPVLKHFPTAESDLFEYREVN